jgi:hypothetical protein
MFSLEETGTGSRQNILARIIEAAVDLHKIKGLVLLPV